MKKDIQDRIVKIVIPLVNKKNLYFSGYIVGNGIILTCQHGFISKSDSDYDTHQKIKISSHSIKMTIALNSMNLQGLIDTKIVLFASEKYDVVLLNCDSFQAPYQYLHLTELDATHGYQWVAGGYPRFNEAEEETHGYKHFSGKCESVEQDATKISLTVTTELSKMEEWKRASGSPVFIENKLAGIVRKYTAKVKHELKASYLKRLWDDPDEPKFRQILEALIIPETSFLHKKLDALWVQYPTLKNELLDRLNANDKNILQVLQQQSKQALMDLCISLLANKLEGVHEFLLYAIGTHYENSSCFNQQITEDVPYINVPVIRVEACEFLMAAEDKRLPSFSKSTGQKAVPTKYSLITPPESGIKTNAAKDVITNLLSGHATADDVVKRIFEDFDRDKGLDYPTKKKRSIVNAMLKNEKGTYYWRLRLRQGEISSVKDVVRIFGSNIKVLNIPEDEEGDIEFEEQTLFANLGVFIEDEK